MDLVVIEAPGKCAALRLALGKCGMQDVQIFATRGHLAAMPRKLWPVGIDDHLVERLRGPRDPTRLNTLREQARLAVGSGGRIVIATDADAEGDAIAWDVRQAVAPITCADGRILRMRLKGLDTASIRQALATLTPVTREHAVPARTRAIVDRILGATFSGRGRVVGRIATALLATMKASHPALKRVRLVLPAADAGRPFVARLAVEGVLSDDIAQHLLDYRWPTVRAGSQHRSAPPPPHMGDLMLASSEQIGLTVTETASALQRLYEEGRLSYPRTGHRVLSCHASDHVAGLARRAGCEFDHRLVPRPGSHTVHDAPYPLGTDIPLTANPQGLGTDEAVLLLAARGAVSCGVMRRVEHANTQSLADAVKGMPPEIGKLLLRATWVRDSGKRWPGREDWQDCAIEKRSLDAVVLECMLANQLGQPSTWAAHAQAFAYRDLLDPQGLTPKGIAWLEAAPLEMRSAEFAKRLEEVFVWNEAGDGWQVRARRVLQDHLPEIMQARIWALLSRESERLDEVNRSIERDHTLEWLH